jgi:hypothetical protein
MPYIKFVKPTTIKIFADYGETKQVHLVDYLAKETLEYTEVVAQYEYKGKKYIKVKLPIEDIVQVLAETCELITEITSTKPRVEDNQK